MCVCVACVCVCVLGEGSDQLRFGFHYPDYHRYLHRILPVCGPAGLKKKLGKISAKLKRASDNDRGKDGTGNSESMQNAFAFLAGVISIESSTVLCCFAAETCCPAGVFTVLAPACIKTMLQAFDCTIVSTGDDLDDAGAEGASVTLGFLHGRGFLDVDPEIKCDWDDPEYSNILSTATVGLCIIGFCTFLFGCKRDPANPLRCVISLPRCFLIIHTGSAGLSRGPVDER